MKKPFKSSNAAARWILTKQTHTEKPTLAAIAQAMGEGYAPGCAPFFAGTHTIRATFPGVADTPATFEFTKSWIYKAEGEPLDGYLLLAVYVIKRKTRCGLVMSFEDQEGRGFYRDAEGRTFSASDDYRIIGTVVALIQDSGSIDARNTGIRFDPKSGEVDYSRRSRGAGKTDAPSPIEQILDGAPPTFALVEAALGKQRKAAAKAEAILGGVVFRSKFPALFDGKAFYIEADVRTVPVSEWREHTLYLAAWTVGNDVAFGMVHRTAEGFTTHTGEVLKDDDTNSYCRVCGVVVRATEGGGATMSGFKRGWFGDEGVAFQITDGKARWVVRRGREESARGLAA